MKNDHKQKTEIKLQHCRRKKTENLLENKLVTVVFPHLVEFFFSPDFIVSSAFVTISKPCHPINSQSDLGDSVFAGRMGTSHGHCRRTLAVSHQHFFVFLNVVN
jgi:hypothetical protein